MAGVVQLVHHGVTGERRMVGLDVQLKGLGQAIGSQKVNASGRV